MSQRRYPIELKERAVRLVFDVREESESKRGAIARIADQLDVNRETLRNWGVSRTRKGAVCRDGR